VLFGQNRFDEALTAGATAMRLAPSNIAFVRSLVAQILYYLGRVLDAITEQTEVIRLLQISNPQRVPGPPEKLLADMRSAALPPRNAARRPDRVAAPTQFPSLNAQLALERQVAEANRAAAAAAASGPPRPSLAPAPAAVTTPAPAPPTAPVAPTGTATMAPGTNIPPVEIGADRTWSRWLYAQGDEPVAFQTSLDRIDPDRTHHIYVRLRVDKSHPSFPSCMRDTRCLGYYLAIRQYVPGGQGRIARQGWWWFDRDADAQLTIGPLPIPVERSEWVYEPANGLVYRPPDGSPMVSVRLFEWCVSSKDRLNANNHNCGFRDVPAQRVP
jgi:hypothetical protein